MEDTLELLRAEVDPTILDIDIIQYRQKQSKFHEWVVELTIGATDSNTLYTIVLTTSQLERMQKLLAMNANREL